MSEQATAPATEAPAPAPPSTDADTRAAEALAIFRASQQPAEQPEVPAEQAAEQPEGDKKEEPQEPVARLWAKAEKKLRKAKEAEERILAREKELSEKFGTLEKLAKESPREFAERMGFSYRAWTEDLIGKKMEEPKPLTREEVEARAQEIAEAKVKEALSAQEKIAAEQRATQYLTEAEDFVRGNEKYELLALTGNESKVSALIETYYKSHGKVLTKEQAADTILQAAERSNDPRIVRVRELLARKVQAAQPEVPQVKPAGQLAPTTLSKDLANGAPVRSDNGQVYRPGMSEDEFHAELVRFVRQSA